MTCARWWRLLVFALLWLDAVETYLVSGQPPHARRHHPHNQMQRVHDTRVAELRDLLLRDQMLPELPEPPRSLGVHTPCKKFGLSCPAEYVSFLEALASEFPLQSQQKTEDSPTVPARSIPPKHPVGTQPAKKSAELPSHEFLTHEEREKLDNLQRFITVLEKKLDALDAFPEDEEAGILALMRRGCHRCLVSTSCIRLRMCYLSLLACLRLHIVVWDWWDGLVLRLLPCSLLMLLFVWIFPGTSMPEVIVSFVLSDSLQDSEVSGGPATATETSHGTGISVDKLVEPMKTSEGTRVHTLVHTLPVAVKHASSSMTEKVAEGSLQLRQLEATRFAVLDLYFAEEATRIFLKARIALCLVVVLLFSMNLYTVPTQLAALIGTTERGEAAGGWLFRMIRQGPTSLLRRVLPEGLLLFGGFLMVCGFIGPVLVVAIKGIMDAIQDWLNLQHDTAVHQERLLSTNQ